ncbi:MAG: leucine-rich repeat protein [Clostridia bacterium]|nr:leucine-rich repeat protein [Clostridia bacterium]
MKNNFKRLMLACVFVLVIAMVMAVSAFALTSYTNTTYSTNYFYGETDKDPMTYTVGETMTFTVSLKSSTGDLVSVPYFSYSFSGDDGITSSGKVSGATGTLTITHRITCPGFVRLTVKALDSDGNEFSYVSGTETKYVRFQGGACAEWEKIETAMAEPDDFDEYWERTLGELDAVYPSIYDLKVDTTNSNSSYTVYDLYVNAPGSKNFLNTAAAGEEPNGATYMAGKLTVPTNLEAGKAKFYLNYQGAGVYTSPGISKKAGYVTLCVYAHSIELSREKAYYDGLNSGLLSSYMKRAKYNDTAEESYTKYMILRDLQAVRFLKTFFGEGGDVDSFGGIDVSAWKGLWNGKDIELYGQSQGGFQCIAVAALDHDISLCNPWVACWCDMYAKNYFPTRRTMGLVYEHYSQKYFDSVALGKRIVCPTNVYTGFGDDTCPTTGVVAAYNAMTCKKQLIIYQGMEHNCSTSYASGVAKQKYTSEAENFKVPYNWTYTFDFEIDSVSGNAFELLEDGKTIKAVSMGTATVTFKDNHYPIVVETEAAIYDLILSNEALDQNFVSGFAKSIYARTAHTAYSGLTWDDLASEINAGNIIKGRTYYLISNSDNSLSYTADEMYQLYENSDADYLVMISGDSFTESDVAMYAMQLQSETYLNAYVCANGDLTAFDAGRAAGNNIVSIIEKNKPVLDAGFKVYKQGGEELKVLSVIPSGEVLSFAVVPNNLYNAVKSVDVSVVGLDFDKATMTIIGDDDGGIIYINGTEYTVYADAVASGNVEGYSWLIDNDGKLTVLSEGVISDASYPWASYAASIKEIELSGGVTEVGSGAFAGVVNLTKITLPYTLTEIADDAVSGASTYSVFGFETNAASVAFAENNGQSFTSLGACGSAGTSLMWEYKDGVLYIDGNGTTVNSGVSGYNKQSESSWYAYYSDITKVVIGKNVTTIGAYAFHNMKALTTVEITENLKCISNAAFENSTALNCIYIAGNEAVSGTVDLSYVTTLSGGFQFDGCSKIANIIFSENLTSQIGDKFIGYNSSIKTLTVPASVPSIHKRALYRNTALKELTILGFSTALPSDMFTYDNNTTSVDVIYGISGSPAHTFAVNNGITFYDLTGDQYDGEITLNGACGTEVYFKLIENDIADTYTLYFYGTGTEIVSGNTATELKAPWASYADKITDVVYRGAIESMGAYNLVGLSNLKSIKLENCAFTNICENAFAGSGISGLFEISEDVTAIDANAFAGLSNLDTIVIHGSSVEIDADAFAGCGITTVYGYYGSTVQTFASTIGATFKNINEYLPVATGYLYATWNNSPTVNTKWYYDKATKTLSFESLASAGAWNECGNTTHGTDNKTAWSIFKNEIEKVIIGPGLKKVSGSAFKDHTALKVVELTGEIGEIDGSAFSGCTNLDTIYLKGNVPVKGIADLHRVGNLEKSSSVFVRCAFDKVIFSATETAIMEGSFANSAVTTVIGNSETTETLATSIGATVTRGYSESGMIWTLDGATLTVYAGETPTAVAAWSDFADTVTKIVFESESDISTLNIGVFDGFANLEEVLFKCDAPAYAAASCFGTNNITVYYAKGISSFSSPNWNGYICLEEGSTLGIVASGLCKEGGYSWAIDDLGTLTISGEGNGVLEFTEVPNWEPEAIKRIAWYSHRSLIKKVVIEEDTQITRVIAYGLSNLPNCTTMIFPTTLTDLSGYNVLCSLPNLNTIAVQGNDVIEGVIDLRNVTKLNSQLFESSFKNVKPVIYISANPQISITKWGAGCSEMTIVTYPTSTTATLVRTLAKQQMGTAPSKYLPNKITLKYYTAEQDTTLVRSGSQTSSGGHMDWTFDDATGTLTFTKGAGATGWNEFLYNSGSTVLKNWLSIWKDAILHVNVASSFSKFQVNNNMPSPFKNAVNLISVKFSGNSSLEFQFSGSGGLFEGCESLTTFGFSNSFNEGVIDISGISKYSGGGANSSMFKGCTSIKSVKMRSSAPDASSGITNNKWITNSMFSGCTSLRSIEIPAWITKIDANAFAGCTSLTSVTLNSLPEIAAISAFPDNEGQNLIIKCPDQTTADAVNALGYTYTKAVYIDLGNFVSAITMEGYAVRLKEYNGLRGLFSFDYTIKTANEGYGFKLVEYGALLSSQATYLNYGCELALADGVYVTPTKGVVKKPVYSGDKIVGNTLSTSTADSVDFAASVVKYNSNFKQNVYICGYEIWEDLSGERIIVYTDCPDDTYDFTNIYQICLNLYRDGYVNAENDTEGIVWGILSENGAVTLTAGTDYTYNEGQTDLNGNSLAEKFVFKDVPAVSQKTSATDIIFTESGLTITLLEDGDRYVAVYRGEGAVPATNPWSKLGSHQLSSNFCNALVLSKLPNPIMAAGAASKIKTIVLDYGVTEVNAAGFAQISVLEKLVYSTSLTKLGGTMFVSCSALNTAYCADVTDPDFVPKSNIVDFSRLSSVDANYMFVSAKKIQYVRLPSSIGTAAKGMFNNNTALKAVSCGTAELVDGVIDMSQTGIVNFGDYSFAGVNNITTLKLPETVTTFFDVNGTTERHAFASNSSNVTSACGIRNIITENEVSAISDYITKYGEAMKLTYSWTNQEQ